ncbi:hypothetical protein JTE90_009204 [Oedothorax gibbosus]|uniref:Uncharacterized protein n=1 Tax=Oedothorax gibbosus TaxID=931172 RepID=A0AAV6UWQ8_9ARAC|nr:hypothetical protein JTE90_009204 [Oedothorax gibbosus]
MNTKWELWRGYRGRAVFSQAVFQVGARKGCDLNKPPPEVRCLWRFRKTVTVTFAVNPKTVIQRKRIGYKPRFEIKGWEKYLCCSGKQLVVGTDRSNFQQPYPPPTTSDLLPSVNTFEEPRIRTSLEQTEASQIVCVPGGRLEMKRVL